MNFLNVNQRCNKYTFYILVIYVTSAHHYKHPQAAAKRPNGIASDRFVYLKSARSRTPNAQTNQTLSDARTRINLDKLFVPLPDVGVCANTFGLCNNLTFFPLAKTTCFNTRNRINTPTNKRVSERKKAKQS